MFITVNEDVKADAVYICIVLEFIRSYYRTTGLLTLQLFVFSMFFLAVFRTELLIITL